MKTLILLAALALPVHAAFSQINNTPAGINAQRNLQVLGEDGNSTPVQLFDNRYEGVKGSPYFLENWGKGSITVNNVTVEGVQLKYNVFKNLLLYINAKGQPYETSLNGIHQFEIQDSLTSQKYVFKRLPPLGATDTELAHRLVLSLYEGQQLKLVMVPTKVFLKANYRGAYSAHKAHDEIRDEAVFYLIGPDDAVSKVKLNKKNLLKALPGKQEQVQEFMAKQQVDANTAEGWKKVLAYYEGL
ncbi:hypothetical protein [uncultured Pontibacter sp.]|uniref:hypothetical protein n=1 Tax=uncultured Pontibacter sp. TaxID=453356 RepID=UPI002617950D|nr:hypothetical protein [uncultured Pontibacter sp.]